MTLNALRALATALTVLVLAGCGRSADTKLLELTHARAGAVDIGLLSSNAAIKPGKDQVFLEFRTGTDQHLIDVGAVRVSATMPMAGMGPMIGGTAVQRTSVAGRYAVETDLGMAGSWQIRVEWDGGPAPGAVTLSSSVQ
jgi:YtkA-like protein